MVPTRYSRPRSIRVIIPYVDIHGDREVHETTIFFGRTDTVLGIKGLPMIEPFDLAH